MRTAFGRGGMARGAVVLGSGTAVAGVLTTLTAPAITRLYDPSELGQYGLLAAFVNIAAVTLTFRLEMAIVSCPSREEAARVALLAMLIVPVMTVLSTTVLLAFIILPIGPYAELPAPWAFLVPIPLGAIGLVSVLRYWVVRREDYVPLSQLAVIQSGVRGIGQAGLGLLQVGALGLFLGDVLGRAAGITRLLFRELPDIAKSAGWPTWRSARAMLARYRHYPALSLPSSFVNTLAGALALPLIGQFYGLDAAGYYLLVQTLFAGPVAVVGLSVADVFHGRVAALARDAPERVASVFLRTAGTLSAIAIPVGAATFLLAPLLFPLIFGSEWQPAGYAAAALAPRMVVHMMVSPLSRIVYVYNGQGSKLIFDVALLSLSVASLTGAKLLNLPLVPALSLFALADVVAYAIYAGILWNLVRRSTRAEGSE